MMRKPLRLRARVLLGFVGKTAGHATLCRPGQCSMKPDHPNLFAPNFQNLSLESVNLGFVRVHTRESCNNTLLRRVL